MWLIVCLEVMDIDAEAFGANGILRAQKLGGCRVLDGLADLAADKLGDEFVHLSDHHLVDFGSFR